MSPVSTAYAVGGGPVASQTHTSLPSEAQRSLQQVLRTDSRAATIAKRLAAVSASLAQANDGRGGIGEPPAIEPKKMEAQWAQYRYIEAIIKSSKIDSEKRVRGQEWTAADEEMLKRLEGFVHRCSQDYSKIWENGEVRDLAVHQTPRQRRRLWPFSR